MRAKEIKYHPCSYCGRSTNVEFDADVGEWYLCKDCWAKLARHRKKEIEKDQAKLACSDDNPCPYCGRRGCTYHKET